MKVADSLFAGHVISKSLSPQPSPFSTSRSTPSSIHFKVGTATTAGSNGAINVYYGGNCDSEICDYRKELSAYLKDSGVTYEFYLPDFDYNRNVWHNSFKKIFRKVLEKYFENEYKETNLFLIFAAVMLLNLMNSILMHARKVEIA